MEHYIDQRASVIPAAVYEQQRASWYAKNEKMQEQMRELKELIRDKELVIAQEQRDCKFAREALVDIKKERSTLTAKVDELESVIYDKDDKLQLFEQKQSTAYSEFRAMNLAKDKLINETTEKAIAEANVHSDKMRKMRQTLGFYQGKIADIRQEYEATIEDFDAANADLSKRNESLKAKCKGFLKQQMDDIDERLVLLRKIQDLEKDKAELKQKLASEFLCEMQEFSAQTKESESLLQEIEKEIVITDDHCVICIEDDSSIVDKIDAYLQNVDIESRDSFRPSCASTRSSCLSDL